MASRRTPGPWMVDRCGQETAVRTTCGFAVVPQVLGTLADARLLAAAPTMYDLLKAIAIMFEAYGPEGLHFDAGSVLHNKILAILARVEGK